MKNQHRKAFIALLTVFLISVIIFCSSILYWFILIDLPFIKYENAVDDYTQTFPVEDTFKAKLIDGRVYKVSKPDFMEFNGTLSVYKQLSLDDYLNASMKDQDDLTLSIKVSPTGKLKYSIEATSELDFDLSISIDDDGNLLDESLNGENRKILIDNYEAIQEMLTTAKSLWGLE